MARKGLLLIIPLIALLIFAYFYVTLISPLVTIAELVVDAGTVQAMRANGEWADASNGMYLAEGDSVRTLADSEAAVIFFESSIMRLGPETEIGIQTLDSTPDNSFIVIRQESGRTWNKILKLSGIDGYAVETPTTVASVRGTSFSVSVSPDGETEIQLVEGELEASTYEMVDDEMGFMEQTIMKESERMEVPRGSMSEPMSAPMLYEMEPVLDSFIEENMEKDDTFLLGVKDKLMERFSGILPTIKQTYGLTDEQVSDGLDRYLNGEELGFGPEIITKFLERRASAADVLFELTSGELGV